MQALAILTAALCLCASAAGAIPGRSPEMVTPVDKTSGLASYNAGFMAAPTPDGNHFFFYSQQTIVANAPTSPWIYRADRTGAGWRLETPVGAPLATNSDARLWNFDDDSLSTLVLTPNQHDEQDLDFLFGGGGNDLYRFDASGAPTAWVSRGAFHNDGFINAYPPRASTSDLRHVVFNVLAENGDEPSLTPEAVGIGAGFQFPLYEYDDGQVRLVEVDDDGARLTDGSTFLGGLTSSYNALSADGSQIFFTATNDNAQTYSARAGLYVRIDGQTTRPIPASPAGANAGAAFAGATPDGSHVFFYSQDPLTSDDDDSSTDLYGMDLATGKLTRISAGAHPAGAGETNRGPAPVWVSEDASRLYFVARGNLVPDAVGPDIKTYVWDNGELRLVAAAQLLDVGGVSLGPSCSGARMTPDGRRFVAETTAALTPEDTDGGARDVYWYDVDSDALRLVSTGPEDAAGEHDAAIHGTLPWLRSACGTTLRVTNPMSRDGEHVFFQTAESLVKGDIDGKEDVYEWNASSGHTELLTKGTSSAQYAGNANAGNSYLLDATPSASDVFVATQDHLVPEDQDEMTDIYDLRVGGGFPHASPRPSCADSDCQAPPTPRPEVGTPASTTLERPAPQPSGRVTPAPARLKILAIGAAELRRLAGTGRFVLRIRTTRAGRLTATLRTAVGRNVQAGRGSGRARARGVTRVTVRLSGAGRRALRQRGRLRLALRVRQSTGATATRTVTIRAEGKR